MLALLPPIEYEIRMPPPPPETGKLTARKMGHT